MSNISAVIITLTICFATSLFANKVNDPLKDSFVLFLLLGYIVWHDVKGELKK